MKYAIKNSLFQISLTQFLDVGFVLGLVRKREGNEFLCFICRKIRIPYLFFSLHEYETQPSLVSR